jgi:excisionase family DNA binding protein
MDSLVGVPQAADELGVAGSRVRALIEDGALEAEKVGGRWLVSRASIEDRLRHAPSAGRPLAPRNAWAALLLASDEELPPIDPVARWRVRQGLARHGLAGLRDRLVRRGTVHRFWALPGELRELCGREVMTGSSAARIHGLKLMSPDTVDAYVPASRLRKLVAEHGLQPVAAREANLILRTVPDDAWMLAGHKAAPMAAVALDLAGYPDSRSSRAGVDLIARLDRKRQ